MNREFYNQCHENFNIIHSAASEIANSTKNDGVKLQALDLIRNVINSIIDLDSRYDNYLSSSDNEGEEVTE
jgi:hypothetical protein